MAKVKWQKRAEHELFRLLVKGYLEFGEATAKAFADKVASLNDHLSKYPETGFPEPLLQDRKRLYRARHIVKRFKLIYFYAESSDTVHVADIWDSRREPARLALDHGDRSLICFPTIRIGNGSQSARLPFLRV